MTLYNDDCLNAMKKIPDNTVDLILADLPYGCTDCKYDKKLDLTKLWSEYKRVLKENGVVLLFGDNHLFMAELILSNKKWFKYNWIWKKSYGTGFLNAKKQPLRNIETISVFYKKQPVYNPQMTKGKPYKGTVHNTDSEVYSKKGKRQFKDNDGTRYPTLFLDIPAVAKQGRKHPAEKPVELLEYLIKTYTNEGMTVLDNCMGSGSTIIAAMNTGRNAIGIEMDEKYFQIAQKRVNDRLEEIKMPELLREDIKKATEKGDYKIWYLNRNDRDVVIDFPYITRWVFEYKNRNNKHYINDWIVSTFGSVEAMLLTLEVKEK